MTVTVTARRRCRVGVNVPEGVTGVAVLEACCGELAAVACSGVRERAAAHVLVAQRLTLGKCSIAREEIVPLTAADCRGLVAIRDLIAPSSWLGTLMVERVR